MSTNAALGVLLGHCGTPRLRSLDDASFGSNRVGIGGTYSSYFHPLGTSFPSPSGIRELWMTNGSTITPLMDEDGVLAHSWGLLLVGNEKGNLALHIVDFPAASTEMAHAVRVLLGLGLDCCHGWSPTGVPA